MKKTTHFLLGCMAAFGGCIQSGDRSDASLDVVRIVTDAAADDTPRATRDGQTYDPRCSARTSRGSWRRGGSACVGTQRCRWRA